MTREQLHKNFKIEMDKNAANVAFGSYPAFLPEEIDHWLNQGMFQELSTKFTGHNFTQVPFEGAVKRIQDLEKLVQTEKNIAAEIEKNTNRIILNDLLNRSNTHRGRMFFVNAAINWTSDSTDTIKRIPKATVTMIDHTTANRFLETYNNKPWIDTPVATIEDNSLQIYVDTYSMKAPYTVDITYVKYPTLIQDLTDDNDELPEYMWYEVVNRAVALALENVESQRVQTKSQLNQTNE